MASIEETLALWAASLREIKKRMRPLFKQARGQDRPDGQGREQDALQQTQRAGQFVQHELRRERRRQHQRDGLQAERIQGEGAGLGHVLLRMKVSAYRSRDADRSRHMRS